jgi:gluconolactonase
MDMQIFARNASLLLLVAVASCSDTNGPASTTRGGTSSSSGGLSDASVSFDAAVSTDGSVSDAASDVSFPDPLMGIGVPSALAGTYVFTEGPLWFSNKLLFSDVQGNTIYELTPPQTMPVVYRNPSANANGNAVGPKGELYTCEHSGQRIAKTALGAITTFVGAYNGKAFNSPNDIIVRADGTVYFTDPNYVTSTQPKQNVFRVTPAGVISVVDDTLQKPNGIALSPDQRLLYVTSASGGFINVYDVATDGSTGSGRKFVDVPSPDGIAIDDAGNLYVASLKVEVFKPNGSSAGSIAVAQQPSNVAFGGADRKTLYITARTSVYEVKTNIPGPP